MDKNNKTDNRYESPEMEIFDLMLEGTLCFSGMGQDSNDSEFGSYYNY